MAGPNDDSSKTPPPSTPKPDATSSTQRRERPALTRPLSYTHVFPARPTHDKPPTTSRSSDAVPKPSSTSTSSNPKPAPAPAPAPGPGPRTHNPFNSTNDFFTGLDFLLTASTTKEPERRRRSPVLLDRSPPRESRAASNESRGAISKSERAPRPQESRNKQVGAAHASDEHDVMEGSSKDISKR